MEVASESAFILHEDGCQNTCSRVGVPGGRSLNHKDEGKEFWRWNGTAFQAALTTPSLYLHILIWGCFFEGLRFTSDNDPLIKEASIDASITGALTFITTFSISSYLGAVMGRYHERFNNCCQTNGNMTLVTLLCASQLPGERRRAATMMRYGLLMMSLYYDAVFGPMSEAKWNVLRHRKLVTPQEEAFLRTADKKGSVVHVWALRIVHELHTEGKLRDVQARRLEECFAGLRGLAAKQIACTTAAETLPTLD